ncbi:MAG: carbohydrate binding family 9 domain-containing protein [Candidatus Eisenbacteria bacterium]|nr:carbohydrate binding family 9 domain-containing protein [Candidatus Eisenbacteria bacterium]
MARTSRFAAAAAALAAACLTGALSISAGQAATEPAPATPPDSVARAATGSAAKPSKDQPISHVKLAAGPIVVDGRGDDPGWQGALEITEFFEVSPGDNAPPPVRTVARMAYVSDRIYFFARCYDSEPAKIRAHLSDRDRIFGDDLVGIMIDTFRDQRSGYEFFINPLGIQGDIARNGDEEDDSFDCLWTSAATLDSLGWTAEFSVPTRSLRFPMQQDQKWGFSVLRIRPRESRFQYASIRLDRNNPCLACQFAVLNEFHGLASGRNLEILPYMTLTGASTRGSLDQPRDTDSHPDFGINVKYGVTPSLTLDGTVHPDFAQVEADQNQVSVNSGSALFFQEKRPFFLEGSSIFQSFGNFFYSRNISDPRWAGKVTGRQGRFQLGVLAARDRSTQVLYPFLNGSDVLDIDAASTDGVVRGKLGLHGESYVGFTGTGRSYADGHNVLGAVDGQVRFLKRLRWTGYLAKSDTRDVPGYGYSADSTGVAQGGWATYQEIFYFSSGYNGGFWYTDKSPQYRADMGYQDQNNMRAVEAWHEWDFRPTGKFLEFYRPAVYAVYQVDHDGVLRYQAVRPDLFARFRGQWTLQAQVATKFSRYRNEGIGREIATHHSAWLVNVGKDGSGLLSGYAQLRVGEDIYRRQAVLGHSSDLVASLNVRPNSRLTATVQGELYRIQDRDVDTVLVRQGLAGVRLTYQFTPRLFVRLFSQYQRVERPYRAPERRTYNELANQFLLSYKLNYASVFFLGVNGNYDDGLTREDGTLPAGGAPFGQTARQVFVKFQYLWQG